MPDILDSDVVTEEVDTGSSNTAGVSSSNQTSPSQEFSFGSVVLAKPLDQSSASNIPSVVDETATDTTSLPVKFAPVVPTGGDVTTLDNLTAVSSCFSDGCETLTSISQQTQLSEETVLACIKWLQSNGLAPLVVQSGKFYCSINNVAALQKQLGVCEKCYGK